MSEEKKEVAEVILVNDKDWFLQSLINMVNSGGLSFGITLNVGGFLVSGELIGGKAYFEGFGSDFTAGFTDAAVAEEIKQSFAKYGDIYSSEEPSSPPTYIHLKNAKCFNTNGKPIPGNKGIWWRGRLSAVDGFSLGSLSE